MNIKKRFLIGGLIAHNAFLPLLALAHGEVDDGHVDVPEVAPTVDERKKVAIIMGIIAVIIAGVIWYVRRSNKPKTGSTSPIA
jgi:arginase family enzyme